MCGCMSFILVSKKKNARTTKYEKFYSSVQNEQSITDDQSDDTYSCLQTLFKYKFT